MRQRHGRLKRSGRRGALHVPRQPLIYAQNPLGLPLWLPRGWRRRPISRWSWSGRIALAVIVTALLLPVLVAVLLRLIGA